MGKLNRKINNKIGKEKKLNLPKAGLSNSLLAKKANLDDLTSEKVSIVKKTFSPQKDQVEREEDKTSIFEKKITETKKFIKKSFETKNNQISKKEKRLIRKNLLHSKLSGEKKEKKEAKAKKVREKTVIVKDIKPMLDDLLNIEDEIKKDELHKVKKQKKKKPSKSTLKEKKRQEEFLKDMAFLQAAAKDPAFVKNPMSTISTHIQNSVSSGQS